MIYKHTNIKNEADNKTPFLHVNQPIDDELSRTNDFVIKSIVV